MRTAALDSLVALNDPRLGKALVAAVRDGALENSDLLRQIEELLARQKQKLDRS